jgi:transposase
VKAQRDEWAQIAPFLDPTRLVFIDETWATTAMTRLYGRAPVGERLVEAVPHGHWMTTTYLAGLRSDGLIAPLVVDGALSGELFRAYVEQHLARQLKVGDIVIMDNLACHKVAGVRAAIEAAGAFVVYLPPYSPDYNPIEQVFAKVKARLRARKERTQAGLDEYLGAVVDEFPADECLRYLRHCGYTLHQN